MIDIDDKIIHLDIFKECFCCDIKKCKGICCIEGDAGAPIENFEETKIKQILPNIIDKLSKEAKEVINKHGVSMIDEDGDLTTAICGNKGACVFVQIDENGIAYCVIEKAWEQGLIDFRKPISCHLYPIRASKYSNFEALNYHRWEICKDAIKHGEKLNLKIFQFLKQALIRKYGKNWYKELEIASEYLENEELK